MALKSISELLYDFGEETIRLLTDSIEKEKAVASRNLRQSITYDVKILGSEFTFILSMADYWRWVDEGRGPSRAKGRMGKSLQDAIYEWIPKKGFALRAKAKKLSKKIRKKKTISQIIDRERKSLAFLIARKIHKKGFKGRKFYSKIVNDKYILNFQSKLREALRRDVEIQLVEVFKEIKK